MDQEREECNISLGLAIGNHETSYSNLSHDDDCKKQSPVQFHILFPPRSNENEEEEKQQQRQQQRKRSTDVSDGEQEGESWVKANSGSKKLRLSHEQASLLEDAFRLSNTLNSFQKHELAEKLKLRPRQVEVWFQNRRARNKMKQTEVDFQLLKKWCETLNEENRRLKKQLQELKATKLSLCSSCEHAAATNSKKSSSGDSTIDC